ncbi:hypothetical protein HS125_20250 [bacterium]|nr:hypothetical protein [bacterium]
MKAKHAEDKFGGEKVHPLYTLRDEKEEPIVSDLLEESGVNFYIHEYDEGEMDKGYGVIMVADNDLEVAQEVIEEYIKERPATSQDPLLEFSEEEGSFMPLGMADKEDEDELEEEDEEEFDEDEEEDEDFEDEEFDEDLEEDEEDLDEDEDEEEEYYDSDDDRY